MHTDPSYHLKIFWRAHKSVVILAALVIVGGIYGYVRFTQKTIPDQVADIIQTGSMKECEAVKGQMVNGVDYYVVCKNNIVHNEAMRSLDGGLCDQLDGNYLKLEDCKHEIALLQASKSDNAKSCNAFVGPVKTLCEENASTQKLAQQYDTSRCDSILDQEARIQCKRNIVIQKFIEYPERFLCNAFAGALGTDCALYKSALANKTQDHCIEMITPELVDACNIINQNVSQQ